MKCCDLIGAATIVAARSSEVCASHQTHCLHNETVVYRTQENFGRRKSANLANCEPITKIFLANIQIHEKSIMAYALTVAYSPNFPCQ